MTELGGDDELDEHTECVAVSGASVGSLLAFRRAFGVTAERARAAMMYALQGNRALDIDLRVGGRNGLCAGRVLREIVADLIGPRVTLGEAIMPIVVGATSLDGGPERGARYLSRAHTPHVLVIDAVVGCHFPGVFANASIPSLSGSALAPDVRLHTDLGASDNTTDHMWDAPHFPPRVHLRLVGVDDTTSEEDRVRPGENIAQALALFDVIVASASHLKSKRSDGLVVDLPRIGNGLCFDEKTKVLDARYDAGRAAVLARASHLATLGGIR